MSTSSVKEAESPRPEKHSDGASPHSEQTKKPQPQPDITVDEVVSTFSDLIEAKKLQFSAQWSLVGAEASLLRQSVLVTVMATLATFAFGCVCWLIINAASAVLLAKAGLHAATVAGLLLLCNGLLMVVAWSVAKSAFKHISITPLIDAVKGTPASGDAEPKRDT